MNRSTVLLIALLIVLGAIVYFVFPSSEERISSDTSPDMAIAIDSASVTKLDIQHLSTSLTIENVGGKWMITSPGRYQADPSAVLQLLHGLAKFKIGSIISSNPDKQHLFQVDSSGTQITATERSGKSTGLIVGKMGPSFSEIYFRLPASKDVYLAEGLDSWSVTKELKEWRDKTILAIPSEAVKQLTYTSGAKQYEFKKDSAGWKFGDAIVESNVINAPLSSLASFRADDFADSSVKFQNTPVTLSVEGAEHVQLHFYPASADSSKFYVQSSASQQIYVVGKYAAQQILKPFDQHQAQGKPVQLASNVKNLNEHRPPAVTEKKETPKPVPPVVTAKKENDNTAKIPDLSLAKKFPVKKAPVLGNNAVKETAKTPPPVTAKKANDNGAKTPDLSLAKKFPVKKAAPILGRSSKESKDETPLSNIISDKNQQPVQTKTEPPPVKETIKQPPANPSKVSSNLEEEGELTVVSVKSGDTMQSIAKKYSVTVEQILKWNLLKSIAVKPGQELYVYVKK